MSMNPFDICKAFNAGKDIYAETEDKESFFKDYPAFIINLYYSMYPDTIWVAHQADMMNLTPEMHYTFFLNSIRPCKRAYKWNKKHKIEDVEMIQEYYDCNMKRAEEALTILSTEAVDTIKQRMEKGGN